MACSHHSNKLDNSSTSSCSISTGQPLNDQNSIQATGSHATANMDVPNQLVEENSADAGMSLPALSNGHTRGSCEIAFSLEIQNSISVTGDEPQRFAHAHGEVRSVVDVAGCKRYSPVQNNNNSFGCALHYSPQSCGQYSELSSGLSTGTVICRANGFVDDKRHTNKNSSVAENSADIAEAHCVTVSQCVHATSAGSCSLFLCSDYDRSLCSDDAVSGNVLVSAVGAASASYFGNNENTTDNVPCDVCLDDYIDADMHLSPVAGSTSSLSSPSLSDDGVVNDSEPPGNNDKYNGIFPNNYDGQHCRNSHKVNNERLMDVAQGGFVSENDSLPDYSVPADSHVTNGILTMQSSGHPSTSSFESLPASLPSPCGTYANSDASATASVLNGHFPFDNATLLSSHCSEHSYDQSHSVFDCDSFATAHQRKNLSYWLPITDMTDCSTCSTVHEKYNIDDSRNICTMHDVKQHVTHASSGTEPIALKNCNSSCDCAEYRAPLSDSLPEVLPSAFSCAVDGPDANTAIHCDRYLKRHASADASLSYSHNAHLAIANQTNCRSTEPSSMLLDGNSNHCLERVHASSLNHLSMRLSTSLTFGKSKINSDYYGRLTQSLHQSLSYTLSHEGHNGVIDTNSFETRELPNLHHNSDQNWFSSVTPQDSLCQPAVHSLDSLPMTKISTHLSDNIALSKLLKYLGIKDHKVEINQLVESNHVRTKMPLCEYLVTCSTAGVSAQQIIDGIAKVTNGRVYGKFFSFYPKRQIQLLQWLIFWMKIGAVPLVTAKLERKKTADDVYGVKTWQHLTVDGIRPEGIIINYPSVLVTEEALLLSLTTESTIEVNRTEIVSRWHSNCNLAELLDQTDENWQDLNVLGQVVNILRENRLPATSGYRPQQMSCVRLPTHVQSGITLFTTVHSAAYQQLVQVKNELPLALASSKSCNGKSRTRNSDEQYSSAQSCQSTNGQSGIGKLRRRKKCSNL